MLNGVIYCLVDVYINEDAQTVKRFLPHPLNPTESMPIKLN